MTARLSGHTEMLNFAVPLQKRALTGRPYNLKLQLNSCLKKLRFPDKVESIQRAIPIRKLEPHVIRHVPVHHWRDSPEDSTLHGTAI